MFKNILLIGLLTGQVLAQTLPTESSSLFSGSGNCAICHATGGPNPAALLDHEGQDVSPTTRWRSSMMGHSAKDPLWQAKVQTEITANPHLQSLIEDKCSTCHAPLGRTEAIYEGAEAYTMAELLADPLALDGVSCTACHQIQPQDLGNASSFSGHYTIDNSRQIFGPHQAPIAGPMQNMLNYTPVYAEHMTGSEMCATCHTLFTPYLNDAGEIAGEAPEQVPYLEWLNSDFPAAGVECQTCHVPAVEGPIVIANRPVWLAGRDPLHRHDFVGGNVFMLGLMRQFRNELGITASESQLDYSLSQTLEMLETRSLDLDLESTWSSDTLAIALSIQNLAGHKFPTAYPSRRAWIELAVLDPTGATVFHSGAWDEAGEILGLDSIFEPHNDIITSWDQVQIYENVAYDINGDRTYTLLRMAGYLKDNRLPPQGYFANGPAADSTRIEGLASTDPNFNLEGGIEGTGGDLVTYLVSGLDPTQIYELNASVHYQSISPRFLDDLFSYDNPQVAAFQQYYLAMDHTPVTLSTLQASSAASSLRGTRVEQLPDQAFQIESFPNPFNPVANIRIEQPVAGHLVLSFYDLKGTLVDALTTAYLQAGENIFLWDSAQNAGLDSGVYLLRVEVLDGGRSAIPVGYHKLVYLK